MLIRKTSLILTCLGLISFSHVSQAANGLWEALKSGEVDFNVRYRFESVEDASPARDAEASTIRTALGYRTAEFQGFGAYLQFEDVTIVGPDNYTYPGNPTPYSIVADPEGTEINQGYLSYSDLPGSEFKLGRQIITYRKAPFHRFIGTVAWRQNWQTMDAATLVNRSLPDTRLSYAYVWNVNRIFGEDAPSPLDDFESNSHLFNAQYTGLPNAKVQAYSYLLDFDNANQFSTKTFGARIDGHYPMENGLRALYAAEYATQSDYADNTFNIDADYFFGEIGMGWKPGGVIDDVILKFNYELQEGSGAPNDAFRTILGTNHPFQGWADRFLVTPSNGVEDIYGTAIVKALGAKFIAIYHDFSADSGGFDYGSELDLLAVKTFRKHYTVGIKYADYNADSNAQNLALGGPQSIDSRKFWLFGQISF